jgi:hypothetical protein
VKTVRAALERAQFIDGRGAHAGHQRIVGVPLTGNDSGLPHRKPPCSAPTSLPGCSPP